MNAMFAHDPRLNLLDRSVLAIVGGIMMCAPSRINEPLCMSVDDVVTFEDYKETPTNQHGSDLTRAHALLLMKGSKGADWGPKPVLDFMIGFMESCKQIILENGQRSRRLMEWYEEFPKNLYLPTTLEYLRGKPVTQKHLWRIINLSDKELPRGMQSSVTSLWDIYKRQGKVFQIPNPEHYASNGRVHPVKTIDAVSWDHVETSLLERVNYAMETARRISKTVSYEGRVSKMLMLYDDEHTPYLPTAIKPKPISVRLKPSVAPEEASTSKRYPHQATIFERLGLTMVVDGKIEYAWISTHDVRGWLTTKALEAKEGLSDVLINKWANRLSIEQLKHYDFRSESVKAERSGIAQPQELTDLSAGLQRVQTMEASYGIECEVLTTSDAVISMTSMNAITTAIRDRPFARTANQIIVIYPTRYGMCTHQHHETPCRSYSCLPCSKNLAVKGHLPSNEEIRKRDQVLFWNIVNQLDRLVVAYNREIADSQETLEEHILALVRQGLSAKEMASALINDFEQIKDQIENKCFRNKLEEAFVARGIVRRLDSPDVASGALIHYNNPRRHAAPGHERALDAKGGRKTLDKQLANFHKSYPDFYPTKNGLQDRRELLDSEDDGDEDDEV